MNNLYKISMLITGLIFTSCNSIFNSLSVNKPESSRSIDVMQIYTADKGLVYFGSKYPGKIQNNEVTGIQQVPLEMFNGDSIVYRVNGLKEKPVYVYSDGLRHDIYRIDNRNMVYSSTLINMPVSDISYIELKDERKSKVVLTGFLVGISAFTVFVVSNLTVQVGDRF